MPRKPKHDRKSTAPRPRAPLAGDRLTSGLVARRREMTAEERAAEIEQASQVSESDLDRAIEQFNRDVPHLKGLLG